MNPFSSLTRAVKHAVQRQFAVELPGDALYRSVVELARQPQSYIAGAVPDTLDGRFDMVALVLALVLIRLESAGEMQLTSDLTERFITDMDGSLREIGISDQVVGKHIGNMVSALGGRLGAYRDALAPDAAPQALPEALARNLYRGAPVAADALAWQTAHARSLHARINSAALDALKAGTIA
ncbi:ubiquinol-cytochrome C chaperone [Polymorphobacter arshaanensis]|uniref:Ubiquinol-cytochrome C chaperone n=1 Tax=Glacieibacterium arshaanense TaxID=2511025 RepID=A0A4Y9EKW6_9SPHN|nr:ubiquinol-cytochrome C chaperone family protein [Polymorphobacter arshaanensis]TFU01442.1 ubiquinol-cytochrome C chaperone [Polymorphobacter arshaanensis]